MNKYDPDMHHRRSIRLKEYDYSQKGLYYITMCVQNRECLFGKITNDKMIANDAGKIVETIWNELPQHFPNTILHEFIVMPNHVHGILEIANNIDVLRRGGIYAAQNVATQQINTAKNQGCINATPTTPLKAQTMECQNPMLVSNLPRFIRWFKGRTTFECCKINSIFAWQRNYYEHIIRDEKSYKTISEYIINNPFYWISDELNN
ncbi:hypothetical protein AGMMS49938_03690 [Fibrobacterales bacterium]|nr:hypothetical protein AGMMS49938_03690 [Fibrobacterales bacterium]